MTGKDIVKNPVPRAQGVKSQNKFILSLSGLTPASSMPSDLIRGCGAGSESRFIYYILLSLSGLTGQSRIGYGFPDQVVE